MAGSGSKDKLAIWQSLAPVAPEVAGQGYPYAPENFPEVGDIWGWRTGRRLVSHGTHFHDRYLYLPKRLVAALKVKNKEIKKNQKAAAASGSPSPSKSTPRRYIFASKRAVERYIKETFPNADIPAFFGSFYWKIPALPSASKGNATPIAATPIAATPIAAVPLIAAVPFDAPLPQIAMEPYESDSDDVAGCPAKNKTCSGLVAEEAGKFPPVFPCDICCSEPGFCRDCSCILCSYIVSSAHGGYSYIKCQVNSGEGICGHVAHMDCALRCLLAGKVGGHIRLDSEYYCRRCDRRTDICSHVNNLYQNCKAAAGLGNETLMNILNIGFRLLCGTEKPQSKELLRPIEWAIIKLQSGTTEDIWKVADDFVARSVDEDDDLMEITKDDGPSDVGTGSGWNSNDSLPQSVKLEAEVDLVLEALRKSQEFEYKRAEETLQAQKSYLQNLYQQLDTEKAELARNNPPGSNISSNAIKERKKQIKLELVKFEKMKKVANGFGRTPNDIVKNYFGLEMVD